VDSPVPAEVVAKIRGTEGVLSVCYLPRDGA
jgi:hypothetical protein